MNRRTFFGALAALPVVAGAEPVVGVAFPMAGSVQRKVATKFHFQSFREWMRENAGYVNLNPCVEFTLPVDRQEVSSD